MLLMLFTALAGSALVVAAVRGARRRSRARHGGLAPEALRRPSFPQFEPAAQAVVLGAVASARRRAAHALRPRDRAWSDAEERSRLEDELARRGLDVHLADAPSVRQLLGRAAPLLEIRPTVHH